MDINFNTFAKNMENNNIFNINYEKFNDNLQFPQNFSIIIERNVFINIQGNYGTLINLKIKANDLKIISKIYVLIK